MSGTLSHIKVLDLSRVLAGPMASQTLGDLGAEVIKVERPINGDDTRAWGPPYLKDEDGQDTSEAAYFLSTNRNKKSVTIDLANAEGQELIRQMAMNSDVLIENFKVGGLRQYGLDYASLSKLNPKLIYCSITGFGQNGPYANRAGYDFLMQGLGGLMSVTGHADGVPGGGPMKVGVALTDVMTGLYAVIGILAALSKREHTGLGQHIDLALLEVQVAGLANQAMNYLTTGKVPQRLGNSHPSIVPYQDFPTADGFMVIAVGNDSQFSKLCEALANPEWASDKRFSTNSARVANRDLVITMLSNATKTQPTSHWVNLLEKFGVPCGPINNLEQVFNDPQIKARKVKQEIEHPLNGKLSFVANPIHFSENPIEYRFPPPLLGQHTREVLSQMLGLSEDRLEKLKKSGVI
jgi:crotonobetainyl-CoA:carnitine CoA-transferase CaiB-like acyl-CoA transferase